MLKNKIFNKKIGIALGTIGALLGLAILVGVAKGNSATVKDSDTWDSKPVIGFYKGQSPQKRGWEALSGKSSHLIY